MGPQEILVCATLIGSASPPPAPIKVAGIFFPRNMPALHISSRLHLKTAFRPREGIGLDKERQNQSLEIIQDIVFICYTFPGEKSLPQRLLIPFCVQVEKHTKKRTL